jgi:release factor glutamine methyltransferase
MMVTIKEAVEEGTRALLLQGQQSARLDAQILLGHVLGVQRATLYAYPERDLDDMQWRHYQELVRRRQQGEPVAYLLGHKEFYGLDFVVDRRVLIPRPETELLVEEALQEIRGRLDGGQTPLVADIGTGSGAIPVTIAVEEPRLSPIYACDISHDALEVVRLNCQLHHVGERVHLLQGDLLEPLPEPVDILTANLPYVGTDEMQCMVADVVNYEPSLALFSGPRGLLLLNRFCVEVKQSGKLKPGGMMLLEIGYQQCAPLTSLLHDLWPQAKVDCKRDYAGWDRLMRVKI